MKIFMALLAANIPTAFFCFGGIYLTTEGHSAAGWFLLICALLGARSYKTKGQDE